MRNYTILILLLVLINSLLLECYSSELNLTIDQVNAKAISKLKHSQNQDAYALLLHYYNNDKEFINNQTLFLLGLSAYKCNFYDLSIKYYKELLYLDSSANRVRLELAKSYFHINEYEKSSEQLKIVKSNKPPQEVLANVNKFLKVIEDSQNKKNWNMSFSLGYLHDSNANAGPESDTIIMYNLPFRLSSTNKKKESNALKLTLAANSINSINKRLNILNSFNINFTDYDTINTLDSNDLRLSSSLNYKTSSLYFELPFSANRLSIGHDKDYYTLNYQISPSIFYKLSKNIICGLGTSFHDKHYHSGGNNDSKIYSINAKGKFVFNKSSFSELRINTGTEQSNNYLNKNNYIGVNISYFKKIFKNTNFYIYANISKTDYKNIEAAYNKKRNDFLSFFTCNISYFYPLIKSEIIGSYSYSNQNCNIETYEYDRNQLMISIMKKFF